MSPTETAEKRVTSTQIGVVESAKTDKTRKVVVSYRAKHPKYGKFVSRRTILAVHDEHNESALGRPRRDRAVPPDEQDEAVASCSDCRQGPAG